MKKRTFLILAIFLLLGVMLFGEVRSDVNSFVKSGYEKNQMIMRQTYLGREMPSKYLRGVGYIYLQGRFYMDKLNVKLSYLPLAFLYVVVIL